MYYLQYEFETNKPNQKDALIALLSNIGFDGFEEVGDEHLKAFIVESNFDQAAFEEVIQQFETVTYNCSSIEHINWNKQWEESFDPIIVQSNNSNDESFVAIRANFHQAISNVQHQLIITPKMSFGTGHHATTHMVIQLMEEIDFTNKSVIDFGTGTGVLAILAEKMGAKQILAIDNDEWSITNTVENIEQNDCSLIEVSLMEAMPSTNQFDVIIANINLNVIKDNIQAIKLASFQNSFILLSGFLLQDEAAIKLILHQNGIQHLQTIQKGDWIAIKAIAE
jgi:ribosomal protein L11 methyltransferase